MSNIFMRPDQPNFIWKGFNATTDYELTVEEEIQEMSPNERFNEIIVPGRNGSLTEWDGDYDSYLLSIKGCNVPYNRLAEVKRWLRGPGKLITHNDPDKYRDAICNMNKPQSFNNEWGIFYTFDLDFKCQPFRKKVNDTPHDITDQPKNIFNSGDETCQPDFEIHSNGGDIIIKINRSEITLLDTPKGVIFVYSELGKVVSSKKFIRSIGDWPEMEIGHNLVSIVGNYNKAKMWKRSVWF